MKVVLTIICLLLMSCDQPPSAVRDTREIQIDNGYTLTVHEVLLDGNVYYATRVNGGFCLCPKLPPR